MIAAKLLAEGLGKVGLHPDDLRAFHVNHQQRDGGDAHTQGGRVGQLEIGALSFSNGARIVSFGRAKIQLFPFLSIFRPTKHSMP